MSEPAAAEQSAPHAIFQRDGDAFLPTAAGVGPWSPSALHGGPPAMLLAREIERFPAEQSMFIARITVELLRPVGMSPITVGSRLALPGKRTDRVEASLTQDGRVVALATGLRIRTTELEVPEQVPAAPPDGPEGLVPWTASIYGSGSGFVPLGVELRILPDRAGSAGPAHAWVRLRIPLLEGEVPTPLVRVLAAADFGNGISWIADPTRLIYVNPDISVHLNRYPEGEWVCLDAQTWLESHGSGLAEGALYDRRGRIGRALQSLFVDTAK